MTETAPIASRTERLAQRVRDDIASGVYPRGGRLPAVGDLARRYRVAVDTVRLAVGLLCEEGDLLVQPHVGYFVSERSFRRGTGPLMYRGPVPLQRQILDDLKDKIATGTYAPGARLPSLRTMAEYYDVSTQPIRKCLRRLEQEGLVTIRNGLGTFVTVHYDT